MGGVFPRDGSVRGPRAKRDPTGLLDQRGQFMERPLVDSPFEFHHFPDSIPIVDPSPLLEFRIGVYLEIDVCFVRRQPENVPSLLLADAKRLPITPDIALR